MKHPIESASPPSYYQSIRPNGRGVIRMADAKLVTARELAEKAGVSPEVLRKIFCKEFNWARKALVWASGLRRCELVKTAL